MAKRKRKKVKAKKTLRLRLKTATVYSIVQVMFFSLAFLIIISFARQGVVLIRLNDYLDHYLSWSTVFLPFIFITFGLLVSKFKTPLSSPNVVAGSLLFFISMATVSRAGLLGNIAWTGIATLITPVGAFIVLMGTTLVGLIIMFILHLIKYWEFL